MGMSDFLFGDHIIRDQHDEKWIPRYLGMAEHFASFSNDPSSKIGAVAVGRNDRILSYGWNDFPRKVKNLAERYQNKELKYKLIVHAELNCIYNAGLNGVSLEDADLYVHGIPTCSHCA